MFQGGGQRFLKTFLPHELNNDKSLMTFFNNFTRPLFNKSVAISNIKGPLSPSEIGENHDDQK